VPKEYLHSAELRDIMQFGSSSQAVFFKMRVAGVLHIFQFETRQVGGWGWGGRTRRGGMDTAEKGCATRPAAAKSTALCFAAANPALCHVCPTQGEDICMALQTHINDVMVKRYTKVRHDVSSGLG
jgi:hypothetical protein